MLFPHGDNSFYESENLTIPKTNKRKIPTDSFIRRLSEYPADRYNKPLYQSSIITFPPPYVGVISTLFPKDTASILKLAVVSV